jgi:F0F1-type ATP synthase epsilon subunit
VEADLAVKGKSEMPAIHPAFQCIVTSPSGKLFEGMATSVVFPAHDGQVCVWYGHIPMLCKLGLGIVKITGVPPDIDTPPSVTALLIDGGFMLLAANVLTITAFEAISPRDTKVEKIRRIIEKAEKLASGEVTVEQRRHHLKKISLLRQLVQREYQQETVEATDKESYTKSQSDI